jgi:hypothetical protein
LSSTVAGLPSSSSISAAVDSALADGLAEIMADVAALEASLADVASGADLEAINGALADAQNSLNDLLTSSNVYSDDVIVNNETTLTWAKGLGSKLAIVNGNVSIYVDENMSITDVQEVVDNIGTVVGSFSYFAKSSTIEGVTFNNIVGTGDIEVAQAESYSFTSLTSAGDIYLGSDYSSKVTVVNFESLTTVGSFSTSDLSYSATGVAATTITEASGTDNTIDFSKATNIHLTALPRYDNGSLTIKADEDSTILIDALSSVDEDGDEEALNLTVEGATTLNFSKITKGNIVATKIGTLTGGSDHDGNVTMSEVVNAVLPGASGTITISDNASLETLHVIGGLANRTAAETADTATPAIDLTNQTALSSVILEGTLGAVTLSGNSNLTAVTFTASADALKIINGDDLETLSIAGKAHSIEISGNDDLESLTITTELNTAKGNTSAAKTSGSLIIKDNSKLASVASAYDPVKTLTITNNDKLASLDFTGTALVGGATDKANVTIGGSSANANALNASKVQNDYEVTAPTAPAVGAGSISDESGLSTLKTYLTAAVAAATSVKVYLDTIDLYVDEAAPGSTDTETNDVSWTSNSSKLVVVDWVPSVSSGGSLAVKSKYAYEFSGATAALKLVHTNPANSVATTIIDMTAGPVNTTASTFNTNPALALNDILTDDALATASAVGVTLNAYVGGSSSVDITLYADNDSATAAGSAATISDTALAADDVVGLTIAGLTGTATLGAAVTSASADLTALAASMVAAWNAVATTTNTIYTVSSSGAVITVTASSTAGSRGDGGSVSIVVGTGADTTTIPSVGYKIGYLKGSSDDKTASTNVIVTVESVDGGVDANLLQAGAVAWTGSVSGTQLTNTTTYTTAPSTDKMHAHALADVIGAADAVNANVTSASTKNYLGWVGN